MRRLLIIAAIVFYGPLVTPYAVMSLPVAWTYHQSPQCGWAARSWARKLGVSPRPPKTTGEARLQQACYASRGLKSPTRVINTVLPSWPSSAQLAAMEEHHEDHRALPYPH